MKKLLLSLLSLLILLAVPFAGSTGLAQASVAGNQICEGIGSVDGGGCNADDGGTTIASIVATALNILSVAGAVIAVIMIIVGGIRFITSNGDSGSVSTAKNTIIYAVVGLAIIAMSQLIVRFVASRLNS